VIVIDEHLQVARLVRVVTRLATVSQRMAKMLLSMVAMIRHASPGSSLAIARAVARG
jgi:hypothetical protein